MCAYLPVVLCVCGWHCVAACKCVTIAHRALQDIKKKIQKCKDEKSARLDLAKMDVSACITYVTGYIRTYVSLKQLVWLGCMLVDLVDCFMYVLYVCTYAMVHTVHALSGYVVV